LDAGGTRHRGLERPDGLRHLRLQRLLCDVPGLVRLRELNPHFSHNYAFVVFDGSDLRADRVGGLGDACGPTKGQAEAVPSFDDVCGGQPSVYALSGSCSGRGVAEANVSEAEFDLVGKG
jgi:hypothetical protein